MSTKHSETHGSVGRELDALLGGSALTRRRVPMPSATPRPLARRPEPRRPLRIAAVIIAGGIATGAVLNLAIAPPVPVVRDGARVGKAPEVAERETSAAPIEASAPPVEIAALPPEMPDEPIGAVPDGDVIPSAAAAPSAVASQASPSPSEPRPRIVQARVAPSAPPSSDPCEAYGEDAPQCHYDTLVTADRRLAAAYDRAVDAGVDVADLRALRREWARARSYADDDPVGVADAYERMAADLRGLASERRGERASL